MCFPFPSDDAREQTGLEKTHTCNNSSSECCTNSGINPIGSAIASIWICGDSEVSNVQWTADHSVGSWVAEVLSEHFLSYVLKYIGGGWVANVSRSTRARSQKYLRITYHIYRCNFFFATVSVVFVLNFWFFWNFAGVSFVVFFRVDRFL